MRTCIPHTVASVLQGSAPLAVLVLIVAAVLQPASGQQPSLPPACQELAFSTEEDFVAQALEPSGNLISDGDLLASGHTPTGAPVCTICARNADLLRAYSIPFDLGLDAVDVIALAPILVAFSTELNSPGNARLPFTAGDLLATNGIVITNQALTARWGAVPNLGLDGLQFVGNPQDIVAFLATAASKPQPIGPGMLAELFKLFPNVDIWFSTEGTLKLAAAPGFLDGDLLSARTGAVVMPGSALLPGTVPAGIPARGVDFGLDAVAAGRDGNVQQLWFSTEILYSGVPSFTDGDVLGQGNGVLATNNDLAACFKPQTQMLGLDALHIGPAERPATAGGIKYHDRDGDGSQDPNEPPLPQWEIHLDGEDGAGNPVHLTEWTGPTGAYTFTVPAGAYAIQEICPGESWVQTQPDPSGGACGSGVYQVSLTAGEVRTGFDFGNLQPPFKYRVYLPLIARGSR